MYGEGDRKLKLTEDDFEAQHEGVESWLLIHSRSDHEILIKQILENQEKAEKLDSYNYEKQVAKLQDENKQLKEKLHTKHSMETVKN